MTRTVSAVAVSIALAACAPAMTPQQIKGYEIVERCKQETGITQGNVHINPDGSWRITEMQSSEVAKAMACAKKYGAAPSGY